MTLKLIRQALLAAALCSAAAHQALAADFADLLEGFNPRDIADWQPKEAGSPVDIVAPLWANLFDELEPMPHLNVKIEDIGDWKTYVADVRLEGYADDSLNGDLYRAIIVKSENGWTLQAMGRQYICARGKNAGKPQAALCP